MAAFSTALQQAVLNWVRGTNMAAAPSGLKLGLLTSAPNADGTAVNEPSTAAGYARQDVVLGAPTTAAGVSTIKNTTPLIFGAATADWAAVTHAAVFDSNGAMLFFSPLAASRACAAGDSISFGATALQLRLR